MAATSYVVLREDDQLGGYAFHSNVEAGSAESAIRKAALEEGTYVAVPARSFQPTKVKVETQTVLRLGTR